MLQGDEFHLKLATAALFRANGAIFYFFLSLYLWDVAITHEHVVWYVWSSTTRMEYSVD